MYDIIHPPNIEVDGKVIWLAIMSCDLTVMWPVCLTAALDHCIYVQLTCDPLSPWGPESPEPPGIPGLPDGPVDPFWPCWPLSPWEKKSSHNYTSIKIAHRIWHFQISATHASKFKVQTYPWSISSTFSLFSFGTQCSLIKLILIINYRRQAAVFDLCTYTRTSVSINTVQGIKTRCSLRQAVKGSVNKCYH